MTDRAARRCAAGSATDLGRMREVYQLAQQLLAIAPDSETGRRFLDAATAETGTPDPSTAAGTRSP